jgi:hypothetical protein
MTKSNTSDECATRRGVRQMLYGKRRNVYRILFEIKEDKVYVLWMVSPLSRPHS